MASTKDISSLETSNKRPLDETETQSQPLKLAKTAENPHHPIFPDEQLIQVQETESLPSETQMKINKCIKTILKVWEHSIESSAAELSTLASKQDRLSLLTDTKISLFRLCVQLRKSTVSTSIQISLLTIFLHIQRFEFREATQSYMKLSIGNVAWPIGVVNVSIHSRSNQSRLHGKDEANIMISEETRRWITAIKRLITFMEENYKVNKVQYKDYVELLKKQDNEK
ncbi:hypothetical protein WICPIJ_004964 [Wickerhamomyces pijperi]|uniref:Pre-mRNA-splicing factor 18 n=1 Tax=Wickerhamomyces pijperi TaxID=599730 RepID=A0A9P8Q4F2_WICPI|nr:hypothetical protein WICPIJ_004964 [Wickerhamomyces pijperi]